MIRCKLKLGPINCVCRVSDASGELEITEVGKYPLKVELLDSKVMSVCICLVIAMRKCL